MAIFAVASVSCETSQPRFGKKEERKTKMILFYFILFIYFPPSFCSFIRGENAMILFA
jgi:hypothetical protein